MRGYEKNIFVDEEFKLKNFDDVMHDILGINNHHFQDLYHFTIGYGIADSRIQTQSAYQHLPI